MQMHMQKARLTLGVLQPLPLTEISPQDLQCVPFFIESGVNFF